MQSIVLHGIYTRCNGGRRPMHANQKRNLGAEASKVAERMRTHSYVDGSHNSTTHTHTAQHSPAPPSRYSGAPVFVCVNGSSYSSEGNTVLFLLSLAFLWPPGPAVVLCARATTKSCAMFCPTPRTGGTCVDRIGIRARLRDNQGLGTYQSTASHLSLFAGPPDQA